MNRKLQSIVVLALLAVTSVGFAKEYNQPRRLGSDGQVEVNKALADAYRRGAGGDGGRFKSTVNTNCQADVGNVILQPGQRPPREVTTVVMGNVINVCK
ncbi:MAG: hypothetical protein U1F68_19565 [Gammaproteobacteria bacterium]